MSVLELETISLTDFKDENKKASIFKRLNHAASTAGIFAITDHGIDPQLLNQCYRKSREFFQLPAQDKNAIPVSSMLPPRGYFPHGVYVQNSEAHPSATEVRENFVYCMPTSPVADEQQAMAKKFFTPITWPEKVEGFEAQFMQLQNAMRQFSQNLWSVFAEALSLPGDYFVPLTDNPTSFTVINYYKHINNWNESYGKFRMSPHTDITTYTIIIAEESDHSLQIEIAPEEWVNIIAPQNAIVVQLGNVMSHWTGNKWRATNHRVLPPSNSQENSRVSIIHGVQTNIGVNIETLPIKGAANSSQDTITCCQHELSSFAKVLDMLGIEA